MTTFDDDRATLILERLAETRPGLATSLVPIGADPGRVLRVRVFADQAVDLAPLDDGWAATPVQLSPNGALTVVGRPALRLVLPEGASLRDVADAFGVVVDRRRAEVVAPQGAAAGLGEGSSFSAPAASFSPGFAPAAALPTRPALSSRAWTLLVIGMVVVGLLVLAAGGLGVFATVKAVSAASGTSSVQRGSGSGSAPGDTPAGTDPAAKLGVGQCFDVGDAYDLGDDVGVTSCTASHDDEVFATVTVADAASRPDRLVYDEADTACYGHYAGYVGDSYDDSQLDYGVLPPSDEQITAGSTTAVCFIVLDHPRSSSVKGSGD